MNSITASSFEYLSGLIPIIFVTALAFVCAKWRWIQLPQSLRVLAIFVLIVFFIGYQEHPSELLVIAALLLFILAIAFIINGFRLHYKPNCDRKVKYEFLLSGVCVIQIALITYKLAIIDLSTSLETIQGYWIAMLLSIGFFLVVQIVLSYFVRPWKAVPGQLPSKGMVQVQSVVSAIGLPVVIISSIIQLPVFLLVYLYLRYILGEYLAAAPIIYLRSFHYNEGPIALGQIVGKVAARFGVIYAVVHSEQKGSELMAHSPLTEQPRVSALPDHKWKRMIISRLKDCSVALIDRTVSSDGLQWEIRKAQERLGSSRIAVLQRKGTTLAKIPGVLTLEYELDETSLKEAREKLKNWFKKIYLESETSKDIKAKVI